MLLGGAAWEKALRQRRRGHSGMAVGYSALRHVFPSGVGLGCQLDRFAADVVPLGHLQHRVAAGCMVLGGLWRAVGFRGACECGGAVGDAWLLPLRNLSLPPA